MTGLLLCDRHRTGARDQPWAERTLAVGLALKPVGKVSHLGVGGRSGAWSPRALAPGVCLPSSGEWRAGEWSKAWSDCAASLTRADLEQKDSDGGQALC